MSTLLASCEDASGMLTIDLWCEGPDKYYISINQVQPSRELEMAECLYQKIVESVAQTRLMRHLNTMELDQRESVVLE